MLLAVGRVMDNVVRTLNETASTASSAIDGGGDGGGGLDIDLSLTKSLTALRPELRTPAERARFANDEDDESDSISLAIPVLEAFESNSTLELGGIYWIATVADAATQDTGSEVDTSTSASSGTDDDEPEDADFGESLGIELVPPSQAQQGGTVQRDASGQDWENDALCLTNACIEATIREAAEDSIETASGGSVPVSTGYEGLWLALYAFPLLAAVMALVPALVMCGGSWHACCAACNQVCLCVLMVPSLFFAGIFFAQVMFGSDVCRAMPAVAVQYAAGSAPQLCESVFSGTVITDTADDFGLCEVEQGDSTVRFRPAAMVAGIFGACGDVDTDGSGAHAIASVYRSFSSQINETMDEFIDDFLNDTDTIGPSAADLLRGTFDNLTAAVLPLLNDDLPEDLGCQKLADEVVQPLLDGFCGDLMNGVYWMVASWYMIGLAVCVCGWPSMVLGYKRFPNELWGPYYLQRADNEKYLEYENNKGCCGGGGGVTSGPDP